MAHRFTDSIREMVQEQMMKQPRHWGQNIAMNGWLIFVERQIFLQVSI